MKVRLFGSFDFSVADLDGDMVKAGYSRGVPMGSQLAEASKGKSPTFLVAAIKDPEGANTDRIQTVKDWDDDKGVTHEKIFDVVWSGDRKPDPEGKLPAVGNTVNLETAIYENSIGTTQLKGVFQDPEFDPGQSAVYYVHVLKIPTPRWALYDKVRFGIEDMDKNVPLVHQERVLPDPSGMGQVSERLRHTSRFRHLHAWISRRHRRAC